MDGILLIKGEVDPLLENASGIREATFDPHVGVRINQINTQASLHSPSANMGIILPKISVPSFNGNILN